jgi:hypothetical protein
LILPNQIRTFMRAEIGLGQPTQMDSAGLEPARSPRLARLRQMEGERTPSLPWSNKAIVIQNLEAQSIPEVQERYHWALPAQSCKK